MANLENLRNLAYAAGFVDGEGSIGGTCNKLRNGKNSYNIYFAVTNNDKRVLLQFKEMFGGSLYPFVRTGDSFRCKTTYQLKSFGKKAQDAISKIYPFLRIKRAQAEIALSFQVGVGGTVLTLNQQRQREAIYLLLKHLNKRGK